MSARDKLAEMNARAVALYKADGKTMTGAERQWRYHTSYRHTRLRSVSRHSFSSMDVCSSVS